MKPMTYEASGVSYAALDPFKVAAARAAESTGKLITRLHVTPMDDTRGESAFLFQNGDHFLAHVEEGLGTKNLVADAMDREFGLSHYDSIAQDTVAMIVNDMITLGAFPFGIAMHLAVGDSKWMENEPRLQQLIIGWKRACETARCCWSGGETPVLKDVILPNAAVLSGSAIGKTRGLLRFESKNVCPGDEIVIFESSGIHANGLSMARKIAGHLERHYATIVPGTEKRFGELLLEPTHIYVRAVEAMVQLGVRVHYGVNVTGHGWRKLMRAPQDLTYVIDQLPYENPIFRFMQQHGNIADEEMYGTFNMGAGFAIFVPRADLETIERLASKHKWGYRIFRAGHVESGPKRVVIVPKNITFEGSSLAIR